MATRDDVRRAALSLPETSEVAGRFAFTVLNGGKQKQFVWTWNERVHPGKPRVPNPAVLAIRVADLLEKDVLLRSDEKAFFTEPHYAGFPAVLVRLAEIDAGELEELIANAWHCQAPKSLSEAFRSTGGAEPAAESPPAR